MMRATNFEYRHQTFVHQLIVGAGFLTYLIDPDDIAWRFVRNTAAPRLWERSLFIVATVLIAIGALLCTRARAFQKARHLGELLYAIGLGSLMPLPGFIILVFGEALRLLRLTRRENDPQDKLGKLDSGWGTAFRKETVKWGIVVTMIVFVITLKDRQAEILAIVSFLLGLLSNIPSLGKFDVGSQPSR
jgi:hypothetical protein